MALDKAAAIVGVQDADIRRRHRLKAKPGCNQLPEFISQQVQIRPGTLRLTREGSYMGTRALVIDGAPRSLSSLEIALKREQIEVVVSDATRGVELISSGRLDVLFAELCLIEPTDLEILQSAINCTPPLPVVMISACDSVDSIVAAFRLGVTDYLTKPIRREQLATSLARALAKKKRLDSTEVREMSQRRSIARNAPATIVAESPTMRQIAKRCASIASSSLPILVVGELGVGKERLVRLIHSLSARRDQPFVKVNCDALQESLLQETFFGESGATGIGNGPAPVGLIEQAAGGTLLLQNVTGLPRWMQKELMQAAEAAVFVRKDGGRIEFRARVAATTQTAPAESVKAGKFLSEFYHHIGVTALNVPPLRSRREDIRPLLALFAQEACDDPSLNRCGVPFGFSDDAFQSLEDYNWPGNIHELRNFVRRAFIFASGSEISAQQVIDLLPSLPEFGGAATITVPLVGDLKVIERSIVAEVINRAQGNKSAAARSLGLHRKTLYRIIESIPSEESIRVDS